MGKTSLKLLQRLFPKRHPIHIILNRDTVTISYCCMRNMKSVTSSRKKQILNPSKEYFGCNCRVWNEFCPEFVLWTITLLHPILCTRQGHLIKPTMNVKGIWNTNLLKHHSKKDSGTILETSSIRSMRSPLSFKSISGL